MERPLETDDTRMTLIGNAWHVGVVCNLLQPLCHNLSLIPDSTVSQIMTQLTRGRSSNMAGKLLRPRMKVSLPFKNIPQDPNLHAVGPGTKAPPCGFFQGI